MLQSLVDGCTARPRLAVVTGAAAAIGAYVLIQRKVKQGQDLKKARRLWDELMSAVCPSGEATFKRMGGNSLNYKVAAPDGQLYMIKIQASGGMRAATASAMQGDPWRWMQELTGLAGKEGLGPRLFAGNDDAMVIEFVPGEVIGHAEDGSGMTTWLRADQEEQRRLGAFLARFNAMMKPSSLPGLEAHVSPYPFNWKDPRQRIQDLPEFARGWPRLAPIKAQMIEEFDAMLDMPPPPSSYGGRRVLVQCDCHGENIMRLLDGSGFSMIDLEMASVQPAAWSMWYLVYSLSGQKFGNKDGLENVTAMHSTGIKRNVAFGYLTGMGLSPNDPTFEKELLDLQFAMEYYRPSVEFYQMVMILPGTSFVFVPLVTSSSAWVLRFVAGRMREHRQLLLAALKDEKLYHAIATTGLYTVLGEKKEGR